MIMTAIFYIGLYGIIVLSFYMLMTTYLISHSTIERVELNNLHSEWMLCWNGRKVASIFWFIFLPALLFYLAAAKIKSFNNPKE